MTIRSELQELKKRYGEMVRVEDIHKWAQRHENSALHKSLEWDDAKAGYLYRLDQIRHLIAVHIVDRSGTRMMVSLSIDRVNPGGGYRDVNDVLRHENFREIMLQDALLDLERVQHKYETLKELASVWEAAKGIKSKLKAKQKRRGKGKEDRAGIAPMT